MSSSLESITRTTASAASIVRVLESFDGVVGLVSRLTYADLPVVTISFDFVVDGQTCPMAIDVFSDESGVITSYRGNSYSCREFSPDAASWEIGERVATLAFYTAKEKV